VVYASSLAACVDEIGALNVAWYVMVYVYVFTFVLVEEPSVEDTIAILRVMFAFMYVCVCLHACLFVGLPVFWS
jgi:hypothetical protein